MTRAGESGYGAEAGSGVVCIVEDDDALADALQFLFASRHLRSRRHDCAEAFLDFVAAQPRWPAEPSCVLLDVRMRRISGLEVFERLCERDRTHAAPVLFLTGHGDIEMAVEALKKGAFDFFEKPFNDNRLADRVHEAMRHSRARLLRHARVAECEGRLARLSARERDVMDRLLSGKRNKLIADELGISMRTVEAHRSSVFAKMQVRSAVELARLLGYAGDPGQ